MEQVYEAFFVLKHYGGWSLFELYNLPVGLREWWLKRTIEEYEKEKKEMDKANKKPSFSKPSIPKATRK